MALSPELIGALTGAGIGGLGLGALNASRREDEAPGDRRKRFLRNLAQGGVLGGLAGGALGNSYANNGVVADIANKLKDFTDPTPKPGPGIVDKAIAAPLAVANEGRALLKYPTAAGTAAAVGMPIWNKLRSFSPTTKANVKNFTDRADKVDLASHITNENAALKAYAERVAKRTDVLGKMRSLNNDLHDFHAVSKNPEVLKLLNRPANLKSPVAPGPEVTQRFERELGTLGRETGLFDSQSSRAVKTFLNRIPQDRIPQVMEYLKKNNVNPKFLAAAAKHTEFQKSPVRAIGKGIGKGLRRGGTVGAGSFLADWLMRNRLPSTNNRSLDEIMNETLNKVYPKND